MRLLTLLSVAAALVAHLPAWHTCHTVLGDTCRCATERVSSRTREPTRVRVSCQRAELTEPLQAAALPPRTVSLTLSRNKISVLKNSSFSHLTTLERLDLSSNIISTIEPGAFLGLQALRRLDLSNNRIGCLSDEMFTGLDSLSKLILSGNIFSALPEGLFAHLPSLRTIHLGSDSLFCDCQLLWLLQWTHTHVLHISNDTLCAHPASLRGLELRGLEAQQLTCAGPLELPLLQLIPSQRQLVFRGDRLPLQCTASYLDPTVEVQWRHRGSPVRREEHAGVLLEESVLHDCCLLTSEIILSNIDTGLAGTWSCMAISSRGNESRSMEIVVLEASAPSCQPEHVANSRGSFRWPRTSAGLLSFLPCVSEPSGTGRAWRRCEPAGRWAEADYGQCVYLSQVTRALQELSQTHVNGSNAQAIAQRLSSISSSAEHFGDSMDVILVTHILEKLVQHTDLLRDLAEHVAGVAGDMTRVEERHLWAAQSRVRACTRIVRCVERVADLQLPTTLQLVHKGSLSILLQVFLLQPSSLIGVACAVAQRGPLALEGMEPRPRSGRVCTESVGGVLLGFRCSAAQINGSLSAVAGKSSAAAASLQLPLPAANGTCRLQVLVFRNGKLFPCTNNATRLAEEVKRGGLSAPVAFVKLDGCRLGSRSFPVTLSLRRFLLGTSWESTDGQWWPVSDPEPPDGRVRWSADGCSVTGSAENVTTVQCVRRGHFAVLMDLKRVLSFPPYPGEFLHPVVYACTAVMLLCLFASIITYIVHHSTIRISRKGWHMLLNFCFHTALTFAVFAGGINRIKYPIFCKAVGIVLHYSSLSTMLWLGVTARNIYKQVSKVPRQVQDSDPPAQHKQPMLRFYLVSGGVPLIICGITAATNIDNYGRSEEAPYCWMAWEPSLGAFYGPVAFIVLVTCVYFLCAFIQMKKHPQRKYELRTVTEEQQRLATAEMSHCHAEESRGAAHMGHGHSHTACSPLSASTLANEHSFKAQLRAAAFTLFLFLCTWTFGALAVSQGHILDMIFSCLYGAFSVTLGLFLLIHHCAKRDDVWHCWCSCCPSRHTRPKLNVNGDSQIHVSRCHLDPPCAGHAHIHTPSAHCKLTNLQAAQNHVSCLSPAPPCCVALHSQQLLEDETHTHSHAHPHTHAHPEPHLHRCVKGRTKPRHLARPREYTYHLPSSVDGGSIHSSHTDSPRSVHERRACLTPEGHTVCHRHPCCAKAEPFPTVCQPEGSSCCCRSAGDEELARCVHVELQPRRQSYPLNPASQNGILKSGVHESFLYSSDSTGNIRTGPWRNETTV